MLRRRWMGALVGVMSTGGPEPPPGVSEGRPVVWSGPMG